MTFSHETAFGRCRHFPPPAAALTVTTFQQRQLRADDHHPPPVELDLGVSIILVWLTVAHALGKGLSPSSILSTWFEMEPLNGARSPRPRHGGLIASQWLHVKFPQMLLNALTIGLVGHALTNRALVTIGGPDWRGRWTVGRCPRDSTRLESALGAACWTGA
jgi:hypothetical protein